MSFSNWRYTLPLRLRSLFRRNRVEQDLSDELHDHLEREVALRIRNGATRDQAVREARMALGGIEQQKELIRDTRNVRPIEELLADVRYSLRALLRNPGFTASAVLVLGLGLGAATAVWSVVNTVLLSELPYPDAARLVRVHRCLTATTSWACRNLPRPRDPRSLPKCYTRAPSSQRAEVRARCRTRRRATRSC